MGGITLPTADTPGYGVMPAKYGPDVGCYCQIQWWSAFRRLLLAKGMSVPTIWQAVGGNESSAGTHSNGGATDWSGISKAHALLAREMGAAATWPRNWDGNRHTHSVLTGCAHNAPARYQIDAVKARRDGLGSDGMAGPDPLPLPKVWRTWREGVAWAEAEIKRLQPPPPEEDIMASIDDLRKVVRAELRDYDFLREIARFVLTGYPFDHDQNADTPDAVLSYAQRETYLMAASAVAQTVAARKAIESELDALRAEVDELHPKSEPPAPVSAFGVDVSRHQTAEQVTAAVAAEGYEFCIINATTGLQSVSSALAANTEIARASGDLVGFYHWSQTVNDLATTPDKSDPAGEAMHFLANSGAKPGDIIALDHEEALGTWEQRVAYAIAWCDHVKAATGATPLMYLNWNWIKGLRTAATLEQWERLTSYPLWLADPSGVPGQHSTVTAKDGASEDDWPIVVHQFSTADNLDRNWTPDLAALRALSVKEAS